MCQQSLSDRLSSEDEDDIISDSAELSGFVSVSNVRLRALVLTLLSVEFAHSSSVFLFFSLPPIKDWLQRYGEGCDGRLRQVS